jgi:hypothetical protein
MWLTFRMEESRAPRGFKVLGVLVPSRQAKSFEAAFSSAGNLAIPT